MLFRSFIADLIDRCRRILSRPMMPGFEIFNACSGLSVSLNELFVELETVTGRPLARMYDSARRVDASDIAMSPALAAQRYDWLPATSIREGLQDRNSVVLGTSVSVRGSLGGRLRI